MFEKMLFYYLLVKNKYMTISPCSGIAKRINPLFLKNVSVTHKFTVQDFYPPPFKKNHINIFKLQFKIFITLYGNMPWDTINCKISLDFNIYKV